ncbi:MAG: S-methyl-5'-thioadenosine phosphorylase [Acidobacteria bacterium]|nr:MAG: S-methyl-5'-thioadenosine phosphorylase [Acidobacteriota bacterium]
MNQADIGIIGGSGLYDMPGFKQRKEVELETPFGKPSDAYMTGTLEGKRLAFLARHGRGHRFMPSEINYRANIHGFKQLGVRRILSASAVGSLKLEHKPMDFVLPDQFVDRTRLRVSTFFGNGVVAHISFADPVCPSLTQQVAEAATAMDFPVKQGGTYVCMEGPAFSTRAESDLYRSWGMDLIGMTNLQEAKLAREAEICYVTIAMVTDYDCWHEEEQAVSVEMLIAYLMKNSENVQRLLKKTLRGLPDKFDCGCQTALENAIITDPAVIPPETKEHLKLIIGKYVR